MAGEPIITVVGNLVADPEARVSQAGKPWVTFRIASTPRVRDRQSGDWSDGEALWLSCRAYGEEANNIAMSLQKGVRVIAQGKLTQRGWTDKDGNKRTSLELEVDEIGPSLKFATAAVDRNQRGGGGGGSYYGQPQAGQAQSEWGQPAVQQQAPPQANWGQPAAPPATQGNPWANTPPAPPAQQQFGGGFDDEQPF